jgi:alkylation response protein AidB-like acyl-CoA dehydrogenase
LGALRNVLPFVSERRVYPDELLIEKSHVQLLLGRIYSELQGARALLERAVTLAEAGSPFAAEAAMAKYVGTDLAMRATSEIVQLYGWRGIDADYGAEKRFRDARITTIFEGSSELQLLLAFRDLRRRIGEDGDL